MNDICIERDSLCAKENSWEIKRVEEEEQGGKKKEYEEEDQLGSR